MNRIPARVAMITDGTVLTFGAIADDGLLVRAGTTIDDSPDAFGIGEVQYAVGSDVSGITNPGDNVGDSLSLAFTLPVGTYLVFCDGTCSVNVATIGARFTFKGSGGLVASDCWLYAKIHTAATTMEPSVNNGSLADFTLGGNGSTTARPWALYGTLVVTTSGTATLWAEVEFGGTLAVQIPRGWAMRVE